MEHRFQPQLMRFDGMPTPSQLEKWMMEHPLALLACVISCVWISLRLIVRVWSLADPSSTAKKMLWSFILFIPFIGWILYAGIYQVPPVHQRYQPLRKPNGKRLFP